VRVPAAAAEVVFHLSRGRTPKHLALLSGAALRNALTSRSIKGPFHGEPFAMPTLACLLGRQCLLEFPGRQHPRSRLARGHGTPTFEADAAPVDSRAPTASGSPQVRRPSRRPSILHPAANPMDMGWRSGVCRNPAVFIGS
jgi:hypothetical protein